MSNHITEVQDWIDKEVLREPGTDQEGVPFEALQSLVNHAELTDEHIRKIYEVIGFMYKDACKIMETGLTQTYQDRTVDEVFTRVQEALGLPMPLDMTPEIDDIPDAANDLPVIQLIN